MCFLADFEFVTNDDEQSDGTFLAQQEKDKDSAADPPVSVEVEGTVGKAPVFRQCEVCSKVLPSMLAFSKHMRKEHPDSEQVFLHFFLQSLPQ